MTNSVRSLRAARMIPERGRPSRRVDVSQKPRLSEAGAPPFDRTSTAAVTRAAAAVSFLEPQEV